jgi:hypothetical protein
LLIQLPLRGARSVSGRRALYPQTTVPIAPMQHWRSLASDRARPPTTPEPAARLATASASDRQAALGRVRRDVQLLAGSLRERQDRHGVPVPQDRGGDVVAPHVALSCRREPVRTHRPTNLFGRAPADPAIARRREADRDCARGWPEQAAPTACRRVVQEAHPDAAPSLTYRQSGGEQRLTLRRDPFRDEDRGRPAAAVGRA